MTRYRPTWYWQPLVLIPLAAAMIAFTICAFVFYGWFGLAPAALTATVLGIWISLEREFRETEKTMLGECDPVTDRCRCNSPETSHQRYDQAFCRYHYPS